MNQQKDARGRNLLGGVMLLGVLAWVFMKMIPGQEIPNEMSSLSIPRQCLQKDADRSPGSACHFVRLVDGDDQAFWLNLVPEEAGSLDHIVVDGEPMDVLHVDPTITSAPTRGACNHIVGSGDIDCRLP